jgi:phosphoribosylpyrophosphate synthetase
MSFSLISESYIQDITHNFSDILNIPIYKMISRQRTDRKIQLIVTENFIVNVTFIVMSSVKHSACLNDAFMELIFLINFCKIISNLKLTVGNAN